MSCSTLLHFGWPAQGDRGWVPNNGSARHAQGDRREKSFFLVCGAPLASPCTWRAKQQPQNPARQAQGDTGRPWPTTITTTSTTANTTTTTTTTDKFKTRPRSRSVHPMKDRKTNGFDLTPIDSHTVLLKPGPQCHYQHINS